MFKPATPGFLTTLTATVLLVVVSFSVPWFKTIYFLKASASVNGQSGFVTFGTLGYCANINGVETCTKAAIGYKFDLNVLLGNTTKIQIPEVVSQWITYALFSHVVALILAAVSAVFGLLAHIREMSMTCFSSCISGAAAFVCLVAFIFDLVLFFLARTRIRAIEGGTAEIGIAIWLTLAAWVLLFISGFMFGIGRCCIAKRPRGPSKVKEPESGNNYSANSSAGNLAHAETMRLEALRAESERKAKAKEGTRHEVGLPTFEEYEPETRLLAHEDDADHTPYRDHSPPLRSTAGAAGIGAGAPRRQPSGGRQDVGYVGGYVPGVRGARTVDEYNQATAYPPRANPNNQASGHGAFHATEDLAERDIYAVLPSNNNNNNTLRPGPTPGPYGQTGHHTQGTSYHSAHSVPDNYGVPVVRDYNASRGEYDVRNPTPHLPSSPPQQQDPYQAYYAANQGYPQYPSQQNYNTAAYATPMQPLRTGPTPPASTPPEPRRQYSNHATYPNPSQFQADANFSPPLPVPGVYSTPSPATQYPAQQQQQYPAGLIPGGFMRPNTTSPPFPGPQSPVQVPQSPHNPHLQGWREETMDDAHASPDRHSGPPPQYDDNPYAGQSGYRP